ncbi:MAG: CARDB domain-containing protein, partial [Bacteroidota bacterium]
MIKKKILLGIATGILFIQSISLKADQYVDLGLSPKNIPDTLLINTQNALDVQLTLHDGTPLRASLYFHISLSADSSNNGLVNFAEEHFFLMDIGYENDVLLNATPKNFLEGNYFISVSYSWGTAGFVDTIPQNNHFFKSIYLKKAEHLSFPANNPLTIIPSDTIYNHQTIKVYDTLDLFNNSQAPREITINYLLTKGLDQKHYETQTIKSMDYVLNPYNNTLFIEFETTLPSDIAAGDLYLASYSEDYNYISSKKIVGAYQEPDIDVSSLQLLNDTFSCNGAIMFEYTIHNPWNLKLNWDRINGYFSKDSVLDKDFDHDLPSISGKTAKPKSDSTFTQGIQVRYMEPGDYYFFIEVSDYFLYENDKSNNIARFQVTLNNDPVDWELTSVEIPDTVCLGQTFTSTLNIQHTTPSLIGQSLYYYMYFSKDSIYDSFDPKIDHSGLYHSSSVDYDYPQNNYSVKLQSTAFADAPGAHYLAYSIDIPHGVSVETTKENNHLVKNIYFKPSKTNLTITEVTRYPESMNTNDYKTIDFTIENNGAFTTNDVYVIAYLSSDSSYSKDDIFLRGYHFDTLGQAPAKGSISFGLPDYLQDTTYSIILVADPENKIIESNESDNQFAVDIDITNMDGYNGMPDLMPIYSYEYDTISIPFDFVEFLDYRYIPYINFNITNKGDVDLNEYPRYKAYISEDKVLDDLDLSSRYLNNIGSIAKGDTVNRFHNLAIVDQIDEPGLYYLFIVMDQDNKIPEKDETNNTLGPIPFNYFPGNSEIFDAGYTNMELSETIIQAGEDLTITLDIKNFGNHTIQSLSGSYIYIDADTTSEFDAYYQEYLSFGSIEPDSTLTVSET